MTNEIRIFDRELIRRRRDRAARSFAQNDFIINLAADYILERIGDSGLNYAMALDLACHTGYLGKKLLAGNMADEVVFSDIAAKMVSKTGGMMVVADEEFLPFAKASFDLITSSMSLHWVNDLPGTLIQLRKCLQPGGMFIATMPGIATLQELRHCLLEAEIALTGGTAPHISPFADVKTLGHLLQRAGFEQAVADSETIQISYVDGLKLLREVRNMGEGNALIKRSCHLRKDVLRLAMENYQQLYRDKDGGIFATAEIITLTGFGGR